MMTDVTQTNCMWPGNGKSNNLMSWPVANKQELDINHTHIIIGTSQPSSGPRGQV